MNNVILPFPEVLIYVFSKCKITLGLYHYCEASLHRDTIKIMITPLSIRYCKYHNTLLRQL